MARFTKTGCPHCGKTIDQADTRCPHCGQGTGETVIAVAAGVSYPRSARYCVTCGTVGKPKTHTRGAFLIEILLWFCFLLPGMLYTLWRLTTRAQVCRACGATTLLPLDSPKARAALGS